MDAMDSLEVPRQVFVIELQRMFRVVRRRNAGQALLLYDVDTLLVRVPGTECAIPAIGTWRGEAQISSTWLRAIATLPPEGDPLVVAYHNGRLKIGSSSTSCRWAPVGSAVIEVPLDLTLLDKLRLTQAHTPETLDNSGLAKLVADARSEAGRRIAAAARELAPLGISEMDLRVLMISRLSDRS